MPSAASFAAALLLAVAVTAVAAAASPPLQVGVDVLWSVQPNPGAHFFMTPALSGTCQAEHAATGKWGDHPAVAANRASPSSLLWVADSRGTVSSLDATTGARRFAAAVAAAGGFVADVAVDETAAPVAAALVWAGSTDGHVYCYNASSGSGSPQGSAVWSYRTGYAIVTGATVDTARVYIASHDFDNTLYALDKRTGARVWTVETGGGPSTAKLLDGALFVGAQYSGAVFCIEATTGQVLWNYTTNAWIDATPLLVTAQQQQQQQGKDGHADAGQATSPPQALVVVGSWDHTLYAIDASSGRLAWRASFDNPVHVEAALGRIAAPQRSSSSTAVRRASTNQQHDRRATGLDVVVAVDSVGHLSAFDAWHGSQQWRVNINGANTTATTMSQASPLVLDTLAVVVMPVAGPPAVLAFFAVESGALLFTFPTTGLVQSRPTIVASSEEFSDGVVLAFTTDAGFVTCIRVSGSSVRTL
jgi:outer membrane protein assembly factor BamB